MGVSMKYTKKEKKIGKMDKKTKKSVIYITMGVLISALIIVICLIVAQFIVLPELTPPKTLYLKANLFPIQGGFPIIGPCQYTGSPPIINSTFYGTLQPNGTECIDNVIIYYFNYTTQRSSGPELITNPKQVVGLYNNCSGFTSSLGLFVVIPNNYTLLCPDIVNATK